MWTTRCGLLGDDYSVTRSQGHSFSIDVGLYIHVFPSVVISINQSFILPAKSVLKQLLVYVLKTHNIQFNDLAKD